MVRKGNGVVKSVSSRFPIKGNSLGEKSFSKKYTTSADAVYHCQVYQKFLAFVTVFPRYTLSKNSINSTVLIIA